MAAVLLLSGVFRSVGFSAYNSLQFADIDPPQMSEASTLSSTMQQVAAALGIAVGAVVVRVAEQRARPVGPARRGPTRWPFSCSALLMLWPLVGAIRLHRSAGDEVAGR